MKFCPHCNTGFNYDTSKLYNFFYKQPQNCPHCGEDALSYKIVESQIEKNNMNSQVYSFIGARTDLFITNLEENQSTVIDLNQLGLPVTARLLHLNYTPQGNIFPYEMIANEPLKKDLSLKRMVFGKRVSTDSALDPKLNITATWIDETSIHLEGLVGLVEAFDQFSLKKYNSSIIPANVSVELPLAQLIFLKMEGHSSKDNLNTFLKDAATYSHQLNVLLPFISSKENLPQIPSDIRGELNKLRAARNDLAHRNNTKSLLNQKDTAKMLTAALFTNSFLNNLIEIELQKRSS